MKLALLLPGYLDSPDYLHMKTFDIGLKKMGYTTEKLDPCDLWKTGDTKDYTITNYIEQIKNTIDSYKSQNPSEVILIGHSMGGFVAIVAGSKINEVSKIVSLCSPPDRLGSAESWEGKRNRVSKRDLPNNPKKYRTFSIPYSFAEDGLKYSAVEEARKMHKPLMIFIAQDDTVCPPKLTEQIVVSANEPYVVRQPNMGHDFRHSQKE